MAVIVGGIGYIGSKLVEDLLARGEKVIGIDNFFATDRQGVRALANQGDFDLVEGSVSSIHTIEKALHKAPVETIYWLAAQASAHPDAAPARYTETTNLLAPRLMLDAAREYGVSNIILASSFKVYGSAVSGAVDETTPYGPFSDLAHLSQCYVEKLLEMYAGLYGMRCLAVRLGIVYGLGPVVKRDYRFMTAPNKFCLQAVRGETLTVTKQGARPMGFIHVADAAAAMLSAADSPSIQGYSPVNAVTEVTSPLDIAITVQQEARLMGCEALLSLPNGRNYDDAAHRVSVTSRLDGLGFRSSRQMRPAIKEMLGFFRHEELGGQRQ